MEHSLGSPLSARETAVRLVGFFNEGRIFGAFDPNSAFFSLNDDLTFTVFPYGRMLFDLTIVDAPGGGATIHVRQYNDPVPSSDLDRLRVFIGQL